MRSERCPRCDSDDCDAPGGLHCQVLQRDHAKRVVERVVAQMTARGWVKIKHPKHRTAVCVAQAPNEIAPSSTSVSPVDGQLKMSTCMYAPRWVKAVLDAIGFVGGRSFPFDYRLDMLIYAVQHDLGDELTAQLSLEGSVAEYLREHAYANGRFIARRRANLLLDKSSEKA